MIPVNRPPTTATTETTATAASSSPYNKSKPLPHGKRARSEQESAHAHSPAHGPSRLAATAALPIGKARTQFEIIGTIGAGKSTTIKALQAAYDGLNTVSRPTLFLQEPVHKWEESGMLDDFYAQKLSPLAFQMTALSTRFAALAEALYTPGVYTYVAERSLSSDKGIFAKLFLKEPHEMTCYNLHYDSLARSLPCDMDRVTIYLITPPALAHERITLRGRESEKGITLGYLEDLNRAHDDYYDKLPGRKFRVDASEPTKKIVEKVNAIIDQCLS